jgi:hypothetical protein
VAKRRRQPAGRHRRLRARAQLHAQLATIGELRPGSINSTYRKGGKPNCACAGPGLRILAAAARSATNWAAPAAISAMRPAVASPAWYARGEMPRRRPATC